MFREATIILNVIIINFYHKYFNIKFEQNKNQIPHTKKHPEKLLEFIKFVILVI